MVETHVLVLVAAYADVATARHDFDRVSSAVSTNAVSLRGLTTAFGRGRTDRYLPGYRPAG